MKSLLKDGDCCSAWVRHLGELETFRRSSLTKWLPEDVWLLVLDGMKIYASRLINESGCITTVTKGLDRASSEMKPDPHGWITYAVRNTRDWLLLYYEAVNEG